jgi:hypothetical protein
MWEWPCHTPNNCKRIPTGRELHVPKFFISRPSETYQNRYFGMQLYHLATPDQTVARETRTNSSKEDISFDWTKGDMVECQPAECQPTECHPTECQLAKCQLVRLG